MFLNIKASGTYKNHLALTIQMSQSSANQHLAHYGPKNGKLISFIYEFIKLDSSFKFNNLAQYLAERFLKNHFAQWHIMFLAWRK
jgi:hypothetical protein